MTDSPAVSAGRSRPARRLRLHPCRYKYVRRIKGKYQARVWVGIEALNGPINLGIYDNENLAHAAIRAWVAAGARPDAGLPPGILPKWVTVNERGGYDATARFAGRTVRVKNRATAADAFRAVLTAAERIREEDGPLPPGVVVRAAGYAVRYWSADAVRVEFGPFATIAAAAKMVPAGYAEHLRPEV
jgi:hypothetical protein